MAGIQDALGFRTVTSPNINPLTIDVNPTMKTKINNSADVLNLINATNNPMAIAGYGENYYGTNKDINKALIAKGYKPSSGMNIQTQKPIVPSLSQIDPSVPGVKMASEFDAGIAQLPIGIDFETVAGGLPDYMNEIRNLSNLKTVDKGEGSESIIVPGVGDKSAGLGGIGFGGDTGAGADMNEKIAAQEERNKAIIADESRMQQGQLGQETEEEPKSKYQENQDSLQALFTTAMEEQKQLFGDLSDDTGEKSIEDYKAQFQKATGIDVSGEPDNKMALMSLGLSLMQNKAGKGFDLSKILGSVGEAGQAAMPAFERARQEAKQGQLAAGKFALQQTKADKDAIKSANTERAKYLRGRRDVILDRIAETATDQQKAYTKFKFDEAIEFLKAGKKSNKYNQIKTRKLIQGNDVLKVDIGYQGTTPMYANPTDNVRAIVGERKKIYRSLGRIDKLSGIITDMYNDSKGNIGGTAGQIVFDKTIGALSALGITDADAWFKTNGVSRNSQAETILRLLVQENKRFILKESGNGVSNLDKKDLEDAFGKIVWTNNLQENLNNLRQIKSLFDAPLSTLDSTLDGFITEKDKYQSTDLYNDTVSIINDGLKDSIQIKPGSGNNARRINVSDK